MKQVYPGRWTGTVGGLYAGTPYRVRLSAPGSAYEYPWPLVRRVRPENDRRAILVVLTENGRETMERARRHHRHGIEQHFSRHLDNADIERR